MSVDHRIRVLESEQRHESIRSHGHAEQSLDDTPYLAYCLVASFKLFISLIAKRWPNLR